MPAPQPSGAERAAAALATFVALAQAAIVAGQLQHVVGKNDYGRSVGDHIAGPIADEAIVAGISAVLALKSQDIEDAPPAPALLVPDLMAAVVDLPLRQARELFEAAFLGRQLERAGGNISATARAIGMERSALHRKLKLLGVIG